MSTSISSRAKQYPQPQGGFLSIKQFNQSNGIPADFSETEREINIDNFMTNYLKKKKNFFPSPYNSYDRSLKLLRKALVNIIRLEGLEKYNTVFSRAIKGAENINDVENANRLLEKIKLAERMDLGAFDDEETLIKKYELNLFDEIIEDPKSPLGFTFNIKTKDLLDNEILDAIFSLTSYEYYANPRYKGKHTDIHLSSEFCDYIFEIVWSTLNNCIYPVKNRNNEDPELRPIPEYLLNRAVVEFPKMRSAFNETVTDGTFDFLSADTIWKLFLSNDKKPKPSTSETLELLMQYIMLINVEPEYEDNIKYLGIYDPNRNLVYTLKIEDIPQDIIQTVYSDVIGY